MCTLVRSQRSAMTLCFGRLLVYPRLQCPELPPAVRGPLPNAPVSGAELPHAVLTSPSALRVGVGSAVLFDLALLLACAGRARWQPTERPNNMVNPSLQASGWTALGAVVPPLTSEPNPRTWSSVLHCF